MAGFSNPLIGFSSSLRAERPRPRRAPLFATESLERKLSPSAYVATISAAKPSDPTVPRPDDLPIYPVPLPPLPPGGPNGPA